MEALPCAPAQGATPVATNEEVMDTRGGNAIAKRGNAEVAGDYEDNSAGVALQSITPQI